MASANVTIVTNANFDGEVLKYNAKIPVLVLFSATWSKVCPPMQLIADQIADTYVGRIKVCLLDIDESQETAKKYLIKEVPTFISFQNGQRYGTQAGTATKELILKLVTL